MESEGNDPDVIAKELSKLAKGNDIIGLVEVLPENFTKYCEEAGANFRSVESVSGFNDRMMILYDNQKYQKLRQFELNKINF